MQNYNSKFKSDINERCYEFSLNVLALSDTLSNKNSSKIISNQLIRSATSIGANIIEAKSSSSRLEFKKYYQIALRSANETKYWLNLLKDSGAGDSNVTDKLLGETDELARMLAAGVIKLKNNLASS
ncbi:MAG: hypothetical protein A3C61_01815 [Candidatus Yanofskybacteria bacterium RIFCSPHIGHO2_02_FULL_39_10]|uniref:Four helix bundle protein n=1 Tax=Candidatus Yanofskybacteria bacterium RIFCSPHIGHO2_02_FULL_39_10 TaxID=1802674 RepID=A0A1F8F9D8_9BACT|nr:MAG: hypothetical protein A3C61_01815 [Candidatus Yanofskybacteria bacterium RIFCSPHIGHO2_02_FULL_39_10]